jgi:hypothetical protein
MANIALHTLHQVIDRRLLRWCGGPDFGLRNRRSRQDFPIMATRRAGRLARCENDNVVLRQMRCRSNALSQYLEIEMEIKE